MFTNFYMWSKKEIDLYPTLKSKDKMNRERYNDKIKIPKLPSNKPDSKYINEAIKYDIIPFDIHMLWPRQSRSHNPLFLYIEDVRLLEIGRF